MIRSSIFVAALMLGAGQAGSVPAQQAIPPREAIVAAAAAAPNGVAGTFEIRVLGAGRQSGNIYLNSETDYRDQRNLTVAIYPFAQAELRRTLRQDADSALRDRIIRVRGEARRVKVFFIANGRRTDKYYYQTHVDVVRGDQIRVIG